MTQKRKINYYITRYGDLVELEQNPCGCHPFDVIGTYTNPRTGGKGNSFSYSFGNQQQINGWVRQKHWERLR